MPLKPAGDVTIFEVGVLYEEINQAVIAHHHIELDLSEVDTFDASAMQLLIAVRRSERIVLTGLTDPMRSHMAELGA